MKMLQILSLHSIFSENLIVQGKKGNFYEKTVFKMDKLLLSIGGLKGNLTLQLK
jgi:hypothetical protein